MSTFAPDIDGFIEAQANLRVEAGEDIVYKIPQPLEWPPEAKINPDNGRPYDATIKPTNEPFHEATKRCLVILKQGSPLRPQADTEVSALGVSSGMDIIIDISQADYEDVAEASRLVYAGLEYGIREAKPFAIGGIPYRQLIYGMQF